MDFKRPPPRDAGLHWPLHVRIWCALPHRISQKSRVRPFTWEASLLGGRSISKTSCMDQKRAEWAVIKGYKATLGVEKIVSLTLWSFIAHAELNCYVTWWKENIQWILSLRRAYVTDCKTSTATISKHLWCLTMRFGRVARIIDIEEKGLFAWNSKV